MSFNEETPLEDILKYVQAGDHNQDLFGHPDLCFRSLRPASSFRKSPWTSTVRGMDLEGVPPLRRTLQLLLKQLDLDLLRR